MRTNTQNMNDLSSISSIVGGFEKKVQSSDSFNGTDDFFNKTQTDIVNDDDGDNGGVDAEAGEQSMTYLKRASILTQSHRQNSDQLPHNRCLAFLEHFKLELTVVLPQISEAAVLAKEKIGRDDPKKKKKAEKHLLKIFN